jgi:hypothetical protein
MAAFTVIDHEEATGDITAWSKTSIPSSYDHLLIVASTRGQISAYRDYYKFALNGDAVSVTNYSFTELETFTTTPAASRSDGQGYFRMDGVVGASALADTFGTIKIWIPNYSQSANFTQVLAQWTLPNNSNTNDQWGVGRLAGLRDQTEAIDEVSLGAGDGFVEFSTFTLYGVTGA